VSTPENRLRQELRRAAEPADPAGAFDRVVLRKARRRVMRRVQVAGLAALVVAGTVGGTLVLARAFRSGKTLHPHPAQIPLTGNGAIAFVADRDGFSRLYSIDPDGTGLRRLTADVAFDAFPAWSPDGKRIAFTRANAVSADIYVMNADGSTLRNLTASPSDKNGDAAWSPDGRRIAFASNRRGTFEIWVMNANGTGVRQLTALPQDANHPVWSPDGKRIAFSTPAPVPGAIYVMNADGTGVRKLFSEDGDAQDLLRAGSWSPDGTRLVFTRSFPPTGDRQPTSDVYVIRTDGSGLTALTGDGGSGGAAWSPDGTKVVFDRVEGGATHLFLMNADGTGQLRLTIGTWNDSDPSWQPVAGPTPSPSSTSTTTLRPSGTSCALSETSVNGDFDGDGQPDVAAADLNGDGTAELVLVVDQGGSSLFLEAFELSRTKGLALLPMAAPGAPGFPAGRPPRFEWGGSVTHQANLQCPTSGEGDGHFIQATTASISRDGTEWDIVYTERLLRNAGFELPSLQSTRATALGSAEARSAMPGDTLCGHTVNASG